jgi:hypothetical protein
VLKVIVGVVLLAHGIGHSLGLLQTFRVATIIPTWHGDSWLLTGMVGQTATQVIGAVIWATSIVGFGALAAVVFGWLPTSWWAPLAIGSALVSLLGVLLFPVAFPAASTVGALAVDIAVVTGVLWFHWVPGDGA